MELIHLHNEMMEKVKIGKVMGSHALKGDLKIRSKVILVMKDLKMEFE